MSALTARVITDRDSGRSRGFGFVNYSSDESASSAISAMDLSITLSLWMLDEWPVAPLMKLLSSFMCKTFVLRKGMKMTLGLGFDQVVTESD
ncbi:hypothetical protein K1719_040876 [Acacia pycnantha]|nr:hypothetical protein K1719_040876 [Acacia pycnantha]